MLRIGVLCIVLAQQFWSFKNTQMAVLVVEKFIDFLFVRLHESSLINWDNRRLNLQHVPTENTYS